MRRSLIAGASFFAPFAVLAQVPPPASQLTEYEWVVTPNKTKISPVIGADLMGIAICPIDKLPVSGGFFSRDNYKQFVITASYPDRDRWRIFGRTTEKIRSYQIDVYVLCAKYKP
jgi:hypothetical protein